MISQGFILIHYTQLADGLLLVHVNQNVIVIPDFNLTLQRKIQNYYINVFCI